MENFDYTIGTIDKNQQLYEQTIELIEKSFTYSKNHQFEIDFAPLVDKNNHQNLFVLFNHKNNEVLGHIGFLKKTIAIDNYSFEIGFLGGISVKEEMRHKGIFKKLLNHVICLKSQEVPLFFLWSDLYELYKKFNFHLGFTNYELAAREFSDSSFQKTKISELSTQEFENIKELYEKYINKKYISIKRSMQDWDSLKKISSANLFIKKKNDKIISYYFKGKGQDMKEIVHEYAFNEEEQNITDIPESTIWSPEKINHERFENIHLKFMALTHIGNKFLFKSFIECYSNHQIEVHYCDHDKVKFQHNSESFEVSYEDFITMVFGPNPVVEFQSFYRPFFISGLDSI